jgi:hypothetical protein
MIQRRGVAGRIRPSMQGASDAESPANYVECNPPQGAGIHSQSQNANTPTGVCLAAVALQVKFGGIFRAEVSAFFSDSATGASIQHRLVAIPFTAPATRFSTGETAGIFFGNDVGQDLSAVNNWGQWQNTDANGLQGNGIFFNGAALSSALPGAVILAQRTQASLTGLLTANGNGNLSFAWKGMTAASVGPPKVRWTRGSIVVLAFMLDSANVDAGDVITYESFSMCLQEQSYP